MISRERKELFAGPEGEAQAFVDSHANGEKMEIVHNREAGPQCSVFYKRTAKDKTIKAAISRETRETFRTQGVSSQPMRPLIVTLEPGDVISFRPKGTRQAVTLGIGSLYHFARMTAARAVAAAKREARKARRAGK